MVATITITALTVVGFISSLLFKSHIKIGKVTVGLYWIIALIGAILLICFSGISLSTFYNNLTQNKTINPIKILIIFFSMTILSIFLDEIGFFKYLANLALKKAGSDQKKLFFNLYLITSFLTIFTSNDIIILTFTPFVIYFCKNAKISVLPYLFCEFVAANTFSMLLLIGNPTNIYLATSFEIGFFEYIKFMFIPCIFAGISAYLILRIIFKKQLAVKTEIFSEEIILQDKLLLGLGLFHLMGCIILLSVSDYIGMEMYLLCLLFVTSLFLSVTIYLTVKRKPFKPIFNTIKRLPFELIPFVLSMFIIVICLNEIGFTKIIGSVFGDDAYVDILVYGFSSFASANILNNIPMSVLYGSILNALSGNSLYGGLFASVIGSNIGAYLTPIGSLAGIMWLKIIKMNNMNLSFSKFIKYGLLISLPTILISLLGLWIAIFLFA